MLTAEAGPLHHRRKPPTGAADRRSGETCRMPLLPALFPKFAGAVDSSPPNSAPPVALCAGISY